MTLEETIKRWTDDVPDTNVGDTISRQAAIDAMCSACGNDCDKSEFVYDAPQDEQVIMCPEHYALSTLPSAQPESVTDCHDLTDDLLSRKAVIDAIYKNSCNTRRILDAVEALPSAQPERKTGRWIYNSPVTMRCDQCGYVVKDWEWSKANYCAGCGSPMRKDGEG